MRLRGPWSRDQAALFLEHARLPIRLACNTGSGFPVVASLWFVWLEESLWCATQQDAAIAGILARDPRCAFEVAGDAPPYHGVRGRAVASLHPGRGEELLRRLVARYVDDPDSPFAGWLLGRSAREVAIRLEPQRLFSWDYRARMRDTGTGGADEGVDDG
ncbi:MAG: pyridoxamine 5'-phosphate oxidase family protein [Myxococcota bacterium]|nr:pyridoxamine 5'-phosphate oxidase family protein [Myxococcota bacterium]